MSTTRTITIQGLPEVACIIGATWLAATGHDGWGWLIFLAIVI